MEWSIVDLERSFNRGSTSNDERSKGRHKCGCRGDEETVESTSRRQGLRSRKDTGEEEKCNWDERRRRESQATPHISPVSAWICRHEPVAKSPRCDREGKEGEITMDGTPWV